jgi:hypothetical protein
MKTILAWLSSNVFQLRLDENPTQLKPFVTQLLWLWLWLPDLSLLIGEWIWALLLLKVSCCRSGFWFKNSSLLTVSRSSKCADCCSYTVAWNFVRRECQLQLCQECNDLLLLALGNMTFFVLVFLLISMSVSIWIHRATVSFNHWTSAGVTAGCSSGETDPFVHLWSCHHPEHPAMIALNVSPSETLILEVVDLLLPPTRLLEWQPGWACRVYSVCSHCICRASYTIGVY